MIPSWGRGQWAALFSCTQPIELDAGDVLIQPRHVDRALFFVASGRLEVATTSEADSSVGALSVVPPGSVVGELAFFDGGPRSAKVWAVTPTRLLKLSLADYERYAGEHPADARAFLFAMGRLLAIRLRNTTARI